MANFNFNKVVIGGRLTKAPELYEAGKDHTVARFSVAVNRAGKDAGADFITCKAWDKQADFITNYFDKGDSICIEGRLETGSYENDNGDTIYTTDLVVDRAYFVDSLSERDDSDKVDDTINNSKGKKQAPVKNTRKGGKR